MRIIAGKYKGHRLAPVRGKGTRPTQDRVREAIFNILEPYGPFKRVADLFAGSGAMGLEAVSRWSGQAVLVDSSRTAMECIRENIRRLGLEGQVRPILRDLGRGVGFLEKEGAPFDLVFLDPPYGRGWGLKMLKNLLAGSILDQNGLLVLEHDLKEAVPDQVENGILDDRRRYGRTMVSFYRLREGKTQNE